jgi:glycosyltransferase involved in cell wall biosynthesis
MKILIINTSDEFAIGLKGGNQYIGEALKKNIEKYTTHDVRLISTPLQHYPNTTLLKSYLLHWLIDTSQFDLVISMKFPTYVINHPNHICYFAHFYRQFYDLWDSKNQSFSQKITRKIIKYIDKRALKKTKKIVAYSKFIQKRLHDEGIKSDLVYCPPLEENFKCEKYEYIFSSSILDDSRKRISLLIKAMKFIKGNTQLIIAGDGPHRRELEKLARNDKRIKFIGYQSPEELIKYYKNALCTCLVSYKEDYGLVTIESMKSKKPVITCSDSGGPLEFVIHNETGLICYPNKEDIARNIQKLINNKDRAIFMGNNGYLKVKDITWENTIAKLLNISIKNKNNTIEELTAKYPIISTMMKKDEIEIVLENLEIILKDGIEGDIVEFGCNQGTTTLFIQRLLDKYNSKKTIHVYDSFEGLPEKLPEDMNNDPANKIFEKGVTKSKQSTFIGNFKKDELKLPIIHKGWFKNIKRTDMPKKIAFAFFDGDFYTSILESFEHVFPILSINGRIVVDDYQHAGLPGVKKACTKYLGKNKIKHEFFYKNNEAIIIKK